MHKRFAPPLPTLATWAIAAAAAIAWAPVYAGDTSTSTTAKSTYLKDRAACDAGKTAEDRATCLKEAGAAEQERRRNTLTNDGSARQNALDRCNALPTKDQAACVARIDGPMNPNQSVSTSGSVAGGGVLRETTTVTPGSVTVIVPAQPPASAPR